MSDEKMLVTCPVCNRQVEAIRVGSEARAKLKPHTLPINSDQCMGSKCSVAVSK